ncbi:MAG: RNase A-like domain-containing protein [Vicinamibacteraceae bacterium]
MLGVIRRRLGVAATLAILSAGCQLNLPAEDATQSKTAKASLAAEDNGRQASSSVAADTGQTAAAPVSAPRRDLGWDEARGGHTLARHVGLSEADLRARLAAEDISAASTFADRETAERVVASALEASRARIERWSGRRGRRPNLVVWFRGDPSEPIGHSLRRGTGPSRTCWDARIALRWDERLGRFFVLTAYPEVSR